MTELVFLQVALVSTALACVVAAPPFRERQWAWLNLVLVVALVAAPCVWRPAATPATAAVASPKPAPDWQAQLTREREAALEAKLQTMLDKIFLADKSLVRVALDLEFPPDPKPPVRVAVRRLTATVLIQGLPAERVAAMTKLVEAAIGADPARKDRVEVMPVAFAVPPLPTPAPAD